jgi:septum formation inhibitor-activating ATPase MinD
MELKKSQRQNSKIKMALQAASGFGKTFSALQIAYGITNDWNKIALVDTESGSANLYSHLGAYRVLQLDNPHSPENYV